MPTHVPEHNPALAASLGFGAPQAQPQGFMGRLNSGIADNSGMMMALGTSLLEHRQNANNPMFNPNALFLGQQMDEKRKSEREEKDKERRALDFTAKALLEEGIVPTIEMGRTLAMSQPDVAAKILERKYIPPQPEKITSDDIKEYTIAKEEGFEGGFMDYMQAVKGAGATRVDARQMGNIPPGYRAEYDDQGRVTQLVPIPGGPVAMEAEQAQRQQAERQQQKATVAGVVTEDIDRAINMIEQSPTTTTGPGGALLQGIPGTTARDVAALIGTVKANAGFDRLQQMREQSPTGGALGQVSQRELDFLQATIGNLEQSQTKEQLVHNLKRVKEAYLDIIHGPGNRPDSQGQSDPLGIR